MIRDIFNSILSKNSIIKKIENVNEYTIYDALQSAQIKSQDLIIVLEELFINSTEHGKSNPDFYFDKINEFYFFAVIDHGAGIHTTIPKNINLSDLKLKASSSIIRLSLEQGITGTGQAGRGQGLFYLNTLIQQKSGLALIASNSGLVLQNKNIFTTETLPVDIQANYIILQIHERELK
jgi:hypothetical protein